MHPVQRDDAAHLREQRREAAVTPGWPQSIDQFVTRDRPGAVGDEEREQHASLPPRELVLDTASIELDDEPTAELHFPSRQLRANIDPTTASYKKPNRCVKGVPMAKQITCECGVVLRGETDGEVMDGARDHMRADHPDLLEKVSDADLQGWIEEV
jgi:predicted small metal-binding protein